MVTPVTSYIVENDEAFQAAIDRLAKASNDFRIPFGLISKDYYRSNKKIFSLSGPGLYPDLGPDGPAKSDYKTAKQRAVGFIYPIMTRTGRLAASMLNPSDPETIRVITKQNLLLGSSVPYLKYHQSDAPRSKIPLRKVVFIDGGPLESSRGASTSARREAWINIIDKYIDENIEKVDF